MFNCLFILFNLLNSTTSTSFFSTTNNSFLNRNNNSTKNSSLRQTKSYGFYTGHIGLKKT